MLVTVSRIIKISIWGRFVQNINQGDKLKLKLSIPCHVRIDSRRADSLTIDNGNKMLVETFILG